MVAGIRYYFGDDANDLVEHYGSAEAVAARILEYIERVYGRPLWPPGIMIFWSSVDQMSREALGHGVDWPPGPPRPPKRGA
jgi:hypothetical protein